MNYQIDGRRQRSRAFISRNLGKRPRLQFSNRTNGSASGWAGQGGGGSAVTRSRPTITQNPKNPWPETTGRSKNASFLLLTLAKDPPRTLWFCTFERACERGWIGFGEIHPLHKNHFGGGVGGGEERRKDSRGLTKDLLEDGKGSVPASPKTLQVH